MISSPVRLEKKKKDNCNSFEENGLQQYFICWTCIEKYIKKYRAECEI